MKVDGKLGAWPASVVIEEARRHEKAGYDGLWSSESAHDPFLPLVLAAEHTERTELGTAIAVAFTRSPMQLAYTAHDLQAYTGGRFILGLGSQVKPHIERRFAMPWSHPAARMREFIMALRAIWSAWNDGTKLRTEEKMALAVAGVRAQIAFYGSTPAYRGVLERHGWGGLGDELTVLSRSSREDRWEAMAGLIEDDVLHAFAVVADPAGAAAEIRRRFGGLIDRVSFYSPYETDTEPWDLMLEGLKAPAGAARLPLGLVRARPADPAGWRITIVLYLGGKITRHRKGQPWTRPNAGSSCGSTAPAFSGTGARTTVRP